MSCGGPSRPARGESKETSASRFRDEDTRRAGVPEQTESWRPSAARYEVSGSALRPAKARRSSDAESRSTTAIGPPHCG